MTKRLTIEIDAPTQAAMDELLKQEMHVLLKTSQSAIMRLAVCEYARHERDDASRPATKGDLMVQMERLAKQMTDMRTFKAPKETPAAPSTSGYVKKADRVETMNEEGKARCERMGGVVTGNQCTYTRYEVTSGGRAVSYKVPSSLASLSDADEQGQYDPSREAWEEANAEK